MNDIFFCSKPTIFDLILDIRIAFFIKNSIVADANNTLDDLKFDQFNILTKIHREDWQLHQDVKETNIKIS